MKVIEVKNGKLVMGEQKIPSIKADQVLIEVKAAGVNRADIFQKQGSYKPPAGASEILGMEVAGIITKCGAKVKNLKAGDKVCALLSGGGYAEYAAADAVCVLPMPKSYDFVKAAGLPEAFFTVWHALFNKADLKKGESLLVHGGASGIGTTAIQIAKVFGVKVFTTAGSDKKCKFLTKLGATAINYKKQDFVEVMKSKGGVDIVLDMVGGDYFQKNFSALAVGGRLISLAFLKGARTEINFAPLLMKDLTIISFRMRASDKKLQAGIAKELHKKIWPLLVKGKISPVIDSVFDFKDAEKAHARMESSEHTGKIILKF